MDVTGWQTQPAVRPGRGVRWTLVLLVLAVAVLVILIGAVIGVPLAYGLLPKVETHITAQATVDGQVAHVTGETNLPDGALIAYSVSAPDSSEAMPADGTTTVRDGRFALSVDISSLAPGPATVYLSFAVGAELDQPLNVSLLYGPYGERLAGEQVFSDSGDRLLQVTVPVEVGT